MKGLIKYWSTLRGYKRQAGAVVALVPVICQMCGVDVPQEWYNAAVTLGSIIWGVGWVDAGGRELKNRMGGKKE